MRKTIFFLAILFLSSCADRRINNPKEEPKKIVDNKRTFPFYVEDELIVWGGKPDLKNKLKDEILTGPTSPGTGDTIKVETCESCDDQLELWSGEAVKTYISGEVVRSGTQTKSKASGDDSLFYSLNFVIKVPDPGMKEIGRNLEKTGTQQGSGPLIAIFDTGINPDIISYPDINSSCKINGKRGWNFVNDNNDVRDDFMPQQHGTVVTKYILDSYGKNDINILPVKILGKNGEGELFDLLCGFAYAAGSGATIINSSLGFYYYEKQPPKILVDYISKVLLPKNILLIAAAGNSESSENAKAVALGVPLGELRNIDFHYFYPGGLSTILPNVICVTTTGKSVFDVSPTQNYSDPKVGTGIPADNGFSFKHPYHPSQLISGSSFATPIFTGRVYAWLNGTPTSGFGQATLDGMVLDHLILSDSGLTGKTFKGRYLKR